MIKPGAVTLADSGDLRRRAAVARPVLPRQDGGGGRGDRGIVAKGDPVYGINTGFGKLASVRIAAEDVETLQRNLILSHCCGVGSRWRPRSSGLIMALKLARSAAARRAYAPVRSR